MLTRHPKRNAIHISQSYSELRNKGEKDND